MLTFDEREMCAVAIVTELGAELRAAGATHEEVVCVLLHALSIAEKLSKRVEATATVRRPACVPSAAQVIADCKTELQRRAG